MSRYLVINIETQTVDNVIQWDGDSEYDPGPNYELKLVSSSFDSDLPWIGWTRNANGEFVPPPDPVYHRYAVVKKLDGLVVDFKSIEDGQPAALDEPASFEYALVLCENEAVQPGWYFTDSGFIAPNGL